MGRILNLLKKISKGPAYPSPQKYLQADDQPVNSNICKTAVCRMKREVGTAGNPSRWTELTPRFEQALLQPREPLE